MKKVMIFSNEDGHFYAHLLPIALAAQKVGYQIILLTNITTYQAKIEGHGIKVIAISLKRNNINPALELFSLLQVIKIIYQEKPDILHNFTVKPILYGSISCLFYWKNIKIINNFLGMGFIFISQKYIYIIVRKIICYILSLISKIRNIQYIVQNSDDKQLMITYKITKESKIVVQCSVGVNTKTPVKIKEKKGGIIFALVSRMLVDKGIYEFAQAAKILRQKGLGAEFWLVGAPDAQNPSSLTISELNDLNSQGYVRYLGFQDVKKIWQKAHVAVLPSYREGLSRALLEAGAYGHAIITTDAPGGRELVTNLVNGLLVKPQDVNGLAQAMELLVSDQLLRQKLGQKIRQDILNHYDAQLIAKKMIGFYEV